MKKRALVCFLIACFVVMTALTGCGGTSGGSSPAPANEETPDDGITRGGTLIQGMGAEPITLNPDGKGDSNFSIVAPLLFNKLMTITSSGRIVCDLAESFDVSEDNLSYTFHLPAGVKFSDGEPLTSDDVKFTFEEILKQSGSASTSLACIDKIECPDDNTVVITLSAVNASFLGSLGYDGVYILPRHVYEGQDWMGDDGMQEPVGTGPFKFNEWKKGVSLSLVKNENYFKGPDLPYLDGVTYSFIADVDTALQSFQNGELDVMGLIPSDAATKTLMEDPKYNSYVNMYASRFYLAFNMNEKPFDDINFRLAVAHALDIDDLITKAMSTCCVKAESYFSPLFNWANDPNTKIPEFNLDTAKEYMEKTGLTKDSDGYYLHITLDTYNYDPFPSAAQVIKAQLAEIGIDVTINMLEWAAWDEQVAQNRNFQMTMTGGYIGPDVSNVDAHIVTGGYFNVSGYSNPRVDELMAQGVGVVTEEDRAPYYQEVCRILAEDQPMIMIGEWVGYTNIPTYVHNYPLADEVKDEVGTSDFSTTWMEAE